VATTAEFSAIVDDKAVQRALRLAPKEMLEEMALAFRDIAQDFGIKYTRKRLQANRGGSVMFRNPTPGGVGGALQQRTGSFLGSFGQRVMGEGDLSTLRGYVGFGGKARPWKGQAEDYINIHEEGGTIRPVNRKFLTIPAEANLTGAGDVRYRRVTVMPDPVFIINAARTGGVVLDGKDGPVMFYLTTKTIRIPPRLNFHRDWQAYRDSGTPRKRVGHGVRKALERAGRG